jgi:predicted membrane protein
MGLFTTAALLVSSVAAPAFDDGVGERDFEPSTFAEIRPEYRHGIGAMRLDFSTVEFPEGEHRIDTYLGVGELRVIVPDDVSVELSGELDIGEVELFGRTDSGIANDVDAKRSVDSNVTLLIDVDAGVGHVSVEAKP